MSRSTRVAMAKSQTRVRGKIVQDNVDDIIAAKRIGSADSNQEILSDGSVRLVGSAAAWKDMVSDLIGKRLNSTAGKVDYNYSDNSITFQPSGTITNDNDVVSGNHEINHEFLVGKSIIFKPHVHWWQQVTSGSINTVVFTVNYRIQHNGQAKTTSWTTITGTAGTDDVWDFTGEADGLYNQITRLDDIVIDCNASDTIQYRLTRTDSTSGNVDVYFFDVHGIVDGFGSRDEVHK